MQTIKCPHCHKDFDDSATNERAIRYEKVPEFADMLSPEAWKVYNTPCSSTIIDTVYCKTCNVTLSTPETRKLDYASMMMKIPVPGHEDHELSRRVYPVQYLGCRLKMTPQMELVAPGYLKDQLLPKALQSMADVCNKLVAEGALGHATLVQCFIAKLAAFDCSEQWILGVYIGCTMDYHKNLPASHERLNEIAGGHWFNLEGELPHKVFT